MAHPCCIQTSLGLSEEPVIAVFPENETEYILSLFTDMKKELSGNSSFHDNMSIYLLMELIARIDRTLI